jgi:anti-anti-sigma factor
MTIEISSSESSERVQIVFPDDFSIYAISDIKQALLGTMKTPLNIDADLSRVEDFDSSGIQMLLVLKKHTMEHQKEFNITSVSSSVNKLLDVYGLTKQLDALVVA